MSYVVGLATENKVFIGADSVSTTPLFDVQILKNEKVFKNRDFLIGYSGSFRLGQILQYSFTIPKLNENEDLYEYMIKKFVEYMRMCLKEFGCSKISDNEEEYGGSILVGYKNRLFNVEPDFHISESITNYNAIGCGFRSALGALHALNDLNLPPEIKVRKALMASEAYNASVRGPFIILST